MCNLYVTMTKLLNLLILSLISMSLYGQMGGKTVNSPIYCTGAINVFEDGDFQLQFTGKKNEKVVEAYPSLSEISTENVLWLSYIAPEDGELTFQASKKEGFLQMVVFQQELKDICGEIEEGVAEIKRLYTKKDQQAVGLDYKIGGGVLYSLPIQKGKLIQVMFATGGESKDKLDLQWKFITDEPVVTETKIVDKRNDDFAPTFKIIVKDKETNLPLVASLSLEGNTNISGLYMGSEFYFNPDRNCNLSIRCEVEGYFFDDREERISSFQDTEIELYLEKVSTGKTMQIEEIEFRPGTSEITKSSEPKLRRLGDFLALNSEIKIEIQGHVCAIGKNTFAGQKVSEARAKRVMKYLIENGIDKKRLTAVGYGNTRPIYPEPKLFYEEQANRRVEIMVR